MIKWMIGAAAIGAGFAFAAGAYVGWKTSIKAVESYAERRDRGGQNAS